MLYRLNGKDELVQDLKNSNETLKSEIEKAAQDLAAQRDKNNELYELRIPN
ncbi:unnamed protein product [Allacma fusca]|uniref:Uncharacterized protein n=1 Tax=Allacma fusca TaxID=39272 RepID=A0A8J2LCL3_9HEXA|nr:unnamed protein product [Allacma fusca]